MDVPRPVVEDLDPVEQLVCDHEQRLGGEAATAPLEEGLQVEAEEGHRKVVVAVCVAVVVHLRETLEERRGILVGK